MYLKLNFNHIYVMSYLLKLAKENVKQANPLRNLWLDNPDLVMGAIGGGGLGVLSGAFSEEDKLKKMLQHGLLGAGAGGLIAGIGGMSRDEIKRRLHYLDEGVDSRLSSLSEQLGPWHDGQSITGDIGANADALKNITEKLEGLGKSVDGIDKTTLDNWLTNQEIHDKL